MSRPSVSLFENSETREFFFTPWHGYRGPNPQPPCLESPWVCVTYELPFLVKPRPGWESGLIQSRHELIRFFYLDYVEVNPR